MEIGAGLQYGGDTDIALIIRRSRCAAKFKDGALEDCEVVKRIGQKCRPDGGIDAVDGVNVADVSSEFDLKPGRHDLSKCGSGVDGDSATEI